MTRKSWPMLLLITFLFQRNACVEQHNPHPDLEKQRQESKNANRPQIKLTQEGNIPEKAVAAEQSPAEKQFQNLCASCHGDKGDGNSAAAASMNPKPRNFHDKEWQAKVDDAHIAKVISEGGASVGLSPTMAPWGAMIKGDELTAMVARIRDFGK